MAKYSKKIISRITKLIGAEYYTVAEICSLVGISKDTYYTWLKEKPYFSDIIQKARKARDEKTVVAAKRSLFKLIEGFYAQNLKTVYADSGKKDTSGKPIKTPKEWTVYDKYYPPRLAAIIFVLCNLEPEVWKNTFRVEVTGKNGEPLKTPIFTVTNARELLKKLSDEDLEIKCAELDKKLEINSPETLKTQEGICHKN